MNPKPILVFGYGNPGRGDDGLGPAFVDAIEAAGIEGVETQSDMQLQVEHVTDLEGREAVLFVDADVSCDAPFLYEPLNAAHDDSYTTHAMSPAAVLHAYQKVYGTPSPPAYLLHIRGYNFELGDEPKEQALSNLKAAVECLLPHLCAGLLPENVARN